jgi:hypothetical protein
MDINLPDTSEIEAMAILSKVPERAGGRVFSLSNQANHD